MILRNGTPAEEQNSAFKYASDTASLKCAEN
jgi:hypothetical protein